ncbi:hypothetical protein EHQ76_09085 [Leptospira barantonii]|uniref:Uncharacterized protein n=1 Tax=Leptospira barantonii TaxID=2023184 RepID=A0A5F2BDY4_9LEPT|nr:hypothetical protein [Leptospira barantonii]TGM03788.1 hypothetical protein EHQ76_09085 [Leptospira barantonii]
MKIIRLNPKQNSIIPAFECEFEMDYYLKENLPIYFDGIFSSLGKVVGNVVNGIFHHEITLKPEKERHFHEPIYFKCDIELSKEAVLFLHESRNSRTNSDIQLSVNINFRNLKISNGSYLISINSQHIEYTIPESDWIKVFCPILGVGKFSSIEVNHASVFATIESKLEEPLYQLLDSANSSFSKGDYIEVVFNVRKFLERVRKKSDLIAGYSNKNINSVEYGKELNNLINISFQIVSKYQHTHSRGNEELNLNVTKQDAQMALFISMSIASIFSKISQNGV